MAPNSPNLLDLDVDRLFEEHKIEEIVEIEKLLDAEIERKRVELRSMVGDRYKDVLAASDAIKNMKTISQQIVDNIQTITDVSENLVAKGETPKSVVVTGDERDEERELIVQVRVAIFVNEQIWTALDQRDNLTAAQFYLLAQHVHMGLSLARKEHLERLPLLRQIQANLQTLRDQIFSNIRKQLESVEITAEETSSNLNALLLLENQSTNDLLNIFIEHRKRTLDGVMGTPHNSVRVQVGAMVRCLVTTIHLLHDCFICYGESKVGYIWQQLANIVEEQSAPTLGKMELPVTPLLVYIPDVIRQFKPKYKSVGEPLTHKIDLGDWLRSTRESIRNGLSPSLRLITSIKGLHIIREEALKIELPPNWDQICTESSLPDNFNVWYFFFQELVTGRAQELVTKKVASIISDVESDINVVMRGALQSERGETDLRWYTWVEEPQDISRVENKHVGLSMKTLGYSHNVASLCEKLDSKFLALLVDVWQYLYGKEFNDDLVILSSLKNKKYIDREELEHHLRVECINKCMKLTVFLQDLVKSESGEHMVVAKSLVCARFLQAVTTLCPHFNKCCTFSGTSEDWSRVCSHFNKCSLEFWEKWVDKCVQEAEGISRRQFADVSVCSMISILLRWDTIEIQEQTEEKVFKSQIKVPLKPTLLLHDLLTALNDALARVLPHTLPKQIHLRFVERHSEVLLVRYGALAERPLNQNQALQFLFDVRFLTTFCIPRENVRLVAFSQEICDKLRAQIDPFDLDVFYAYLQNNVKRAVLQSQAILGCLLPSSGQLANLGAGEKNKEQEREPSVLALSAPSLAFPMFCTFSHQMPSQKGAVPGAQEAAKVLSPRPSRATPKRLQDPAAAIRSSAAALFGGLTTDWFS